MSVFDNISLIISNPWELIRLIVKTVSVSSLYGYAMIILTKTWDWLEPVTPTVIHDQVDAFIGILAGPEVAHVFGLAAYFLDFIVPVPVFDAFVTLAIIAYVKALFIRMCLWVYVKIWGAV